MSSTPTLWAEQNKTPGRKIRAKEWDRKQGAWVDVVDARGNPVYERAPAVGVIGDPSTGMRPWAGGRNRTVRFLRHDGHITTVTLTGAAAAVPDDQSYAESTRAKADHFGWVEFGHCPVEDAITRPRFGVLKLASSANRSDADANRRCSHWWRGGPIGNSTPCKHWLAEIDARRAAHVAQDATYAEAMKTGADRQADALAKFVEVAAGRVVAQAVAIEATAPKGKG